MNKIPEIVQTAWSNREGPAVLATADRTGRPNAIYVNSLRLHADGTVVVADNYFHKTRANIHAGSKGAFLFITRDHKSYQLKGSFSYLTTGPVFDDMKTWNPSKHPGVAAASLQVEEIYCGAERLL